MAFEAVRDSRVFMWSVLLAGPTIFLHESGHWLTARSFGHEVEMHSSRITNVGEFEITAVEQIARAGAGPAVSILLALLGYTLIAKPNWREFAIALIATAVCRTLLIMPHLVFGPLRAILGTDTEKPHFDEYIFMDELGLPVWPLLLALLFFLIWLARVIHQEFRAHRRLRHWLALVCGVGAGVAIWMAVVGPAIFG